jgi:hypothetical protein
MCCSTRHGVHSHSRWPREDADEWALLVSEFSIDYPKPSQTPENKNRERHLPYSIFFWKIEN